MLNKITKTSPMKEILASYKVRFKTKKGFLTWITFTITWYGVLIAYLNPINVLITNYVLGLGINIFLSKSVVTPLVISLIFTPISLTLTFLIILAYNSIRGMFK